MSTNKFLTIVNGAKKLVSAIAQSTGASDASKIIATGSDGKIDSSFLPAGIALQTQAMTAFEALNAGDYVNIFSDTGVQKCRKADASNGRAAHGYVLAAVSANQTATVYKTGSNSAKSGLTPGDKRYLSATTPGASSSTPPALNTGTIVQLLGYADSQTSELFEYDEPVEVA